MSQVPCPPCLDDTGYLAAPDCYSEKRRLKSVEPYLNLKHWEHPEIFKLIVLKVNRMYGVSGVCITLVHRNQALIKFEANFGFRDVPRQISIESHCILSANGLVLLDATKDWRTKRNPLVTGPPHLKFYAGSHLVDDQGTIIGALSIFDSYPKMSFSTQQIGDLKALAGEVMELLNTPYEAYFARKGTRERKHDKSMDAEVKALSKQLGRATSRGNGMTIFEKDGSGNSYSHNSRLRLTIQNPQSQTLNSGSLSDSEKKRVVRKISNMANVKLAAEALCTSIAVTHKIDFVSIIEIRMADTYTIPVEYLPSKIKKIDIDQFKHANKLMKCRLKSGQGEFFLARMLGICGSEYQVLDFDEEMLRRAFANEFGVRYLNKLGSAKYNSGVLMSIHKNDTKLVRGPTKSSNQVEVYLRHGGYLLTVFNMRCGDFSQQEISRLFDHVSYLRKLYLV